MRKLFFLSFLIFFILFGCSKDSTEIPETDSENPIEEETIEEPLAPKNEVYFTLNTFTGDYISENTEYWVIIHNSKGELLDYRQYQFGDQFNLEAPVDSLTDKISITYFTKSSVNEQESYQIYSKTNIDKGIVETKGSIAAATNEEPIKTGEFDFTVRNIPLWEDIGFSNIQISSESGRLGGTGSGTRYSNGIYDYIRNIYKYDGINNYFVSCIDENNNLKFYYNNNPLGTDIITDFQSDFIFPDKDISFQLPPHESFYLNVAGFEENQEYGEYYEGYLFNEVISQIDTDISTSPLRIGYSNLFPKYRTIFSIGFTDYSYSIAKYGNSLDAINIPDKPTFKIINKSIQDFKFEINHSFNQVSHIWRYSENTNLISVYWSITNPEINEHTIGIIPSEIQEKYPNLDLDKLIYKSTIIIFEVEGGVYNSQQSITLPAE